MMRRLTATVMVNLRRQVAEGFWGAAIIVALVMAAVLRTIDVDWAMWWPLIVIVELTVTAFYFAAVQVLMQRSEGTLEAQMTSPLRDWEYLLGLVVSLVVLAVVEMSVLVIVGVDGVTNWPAHLTAIVITATLYTLHGVIAISWYSSISQFLLPSGLWTAGFAIPLLPLFGVPTGRWMWLHPLQPVVVLVEVGFGRTEGVRAFPALAAASFWILAGFRLATIRYRHLAEGERE